jgi:hypothetical protein
MCTGLEDYVKVGGFEPPISRSQIARVEPLHYTLLFANDAGKSRNLFK